MKHNLLTSLAAAAMIFGASVQASADATTVYEKTEVTGWSSDDLTTTASTIDKWTVTGIVKYNYLTGTYIDSDNGLQTTARNKNTSSTSTLTFNHTTFSTVSIDAVWNVGASTTNVESNYTSFSYGGFEARYYTYGKNFYAIVNGEQITLSSPENSTDLNISLTINSYTNEITAASITDDNGTEYLSLETLGNYTTVTDDVDFSQVVITSVHGYSSSYTYSFLKTITISEEANEVKTAKYTVNFVNESDDIIADAQEYEGEVDTTPTVAESDKADITYNGQKYIYSSDNSKSVTIADDNSSEVTIIFREAKTYSYTVVASTGETIASSSDFEGETITVSYGKYILIEDVLYYAANQTSSNYYYQYSFTLSQDKQVETITYTSSIENVVYFKEAEDIDGMTPSNTGNAPARCSMAYGAYAENDVTITTLEAGTYKIGVQTLSTNASPSTTFTFTIGENNTYSTTLVAGIYSEESAEFTISESTPVVLGAAGVAKEVLDYIYITGTVATSGSGEVTAIEALEAEREADDTIYDLSGRKVVGEPAPGLYIKGGKKYLVR